MKQFQSNSTLCIRDKQKHLDIGHGASKLVPHLWINQEWNPAHDHKEAWRQVVGDHVEGGLPWQHQLEARHRVVHVEGLVARVLRVEGVNVNIIVQDGPNSFLFSGQELISEN